MMNIFWVMRQMNKGRTRGSQKVEGLPVDVALGLVFFINVDYNVDV